ncbi:hypothetical protein DFH27DRAFT_584579 [Peziza echinospora]|nr:hypothetical protein DFH27DRAFT_584579 [Peziza echinospora]
MPVLNPFLRAFFNSHIASQCVPVEDHILLVPVTEILTNTRDRESGTLYSDLAGQDEFMGSHILRIPGGPTTNLNSTIGSRESRGKARQFTTFNRRTVVIKDTWIYSNKGFRSLNQAQLLHDVVFYPDGVEPQPWLIYYISRPLIGSLEQIFPPTATLQKKPPRAETVSNSKTGSSSNALPTVSMINSRKKNITSFNELLQLFPLIARQTEVGLEDIFHTFTKSFEKPLPPSPTSSRQSISSRTSSRAAGNGESTGVSFASDRQSGGDYRSIRTVADEFSIRKALEIAVTSAIDLFQKVDQSQLTLIASTTDLTGPMVERLLERYVTEQLHEGILFPRVCSSKRSEDLDLEYKIKSMEHVDLTQVGIPFMDQRSKVCLVKRLTKAIETFRKIGSAKSPHAMMDLLLQAAHSLTMIDEEEPAESGKEKSEPDEEKERLKEKGNTTVVTMNADMLVSLLLIVVIRSKVPHLTACLSYMRNYVFIDDVEQGEIGYILSTLEAVIYHIVQDNDQLSLASSRNLDLWKCIKKGNLDGVRRILDPSSFDDQAQSSEEDGDSDGGDPAGVEERAVLTTNIPYDSDDESDLEEKSISGSEGSACVSETVESGEVMSGSDALSMDTDNVEDEREAEEDGLIEPEEAPVEFLTYGATSGYIHNGVWINNAVARLTLNDERWSQGSGSETESTTRPDDVSPPEID